jgi:hypothetical protein
MTGLSVSGNAEIEAFIAMHQLDERVSAALPTLTPDQQRSILDSPMDKSRNASALVWSRIRKLQEAGVSMGRGAGISHMPTGIPDSGNAAAAQMTTRAPVSNTAEIEAFIAMHQLDERVSGVLLSLAPDQQRAVLDGPMDKSRNASALVWSRIRKVQEGRGIKRSREDAADYTTQGMPAFAALQSQMMMHGMSALEMPAGSPQLQSQMMMPGLPGLGMPAVHNANLELLNAEMARLQALIAATQQAAQVGHYSSNGLLGLPSLPSTAALFGPSGFYADPRAASNRSMMESPRQPVLPPMQPQALLPMQLQDVETYIQRNRLDERVSKYLRELPPAKQQASVPNRLDWHSAAAATARPFLPR